MNINITDENFATLAICAVRYCQGRQTYMPSLVRSIIKPYLYLLATKDIKVMLEDCKFQEQLNLYGSETIDKPGWVNWKYDLELELSRRHESDD